MIEVSGLKQFRAALLKAQVATPKDITGAMNEAAEIIVHDVVPEMESMFVSDPSRLDGALERSVRASSTVKEGRVSVGYPKKTPYGGWWEFGGPSRKSSRPPNREYVKEGRVLYPTFKKDEAEVIALLELVLKQLADLIDPGGSL